MATSIRTHLLDADGYPDELRALRK